MTRLGGLRGSGSDDPLVRHFSEMVGAIDAAGDLAEKELAHQRELSELFLSLTDVLDSFDRLLAPSPVPVSAEACLQTCRLIARQLELALIRAGLTTFGRPGEFADPSRHSVFEVLPQPGRRDGEVVELLRRGSEWNGRVLRPAEVIVVHNQEGDQ